MNDQVFVGISKGFQHLFEQSNPFLKRTAVLTAVLVDGNSGNIFHDNIGIAIVGHSAIIKPGNAPVMQAGQNILFTPEAANIIRRSPAVANYLNSNLMLELFIRTFSLIDGPHAAFANLFYDSIGAYLFANERMF